MKDAGDQHRLTPPVAIQDGARSHEQSLRRALWRQFNEGEIEVVEVPVDPRYELGAIMSLRGSGSTQYFSSVNGTSIPVLGNMLNTRRKIASALGASEADLHRRLLEAIDTGIEPVLVDAGPVMETTVRAPIDVAKLLPVPTWFEKESGPYISAGIVIAKDPVTGARNVSIARMLVLGGDRLMAGIAPNHHLSQLMYKAHALGRNLEIAIVIGNHPAVLVASQLYLSLGFDELTVAGSLLAQPIELVRCKTVDLEVPAHAEIVLEATLHADEEVNEGLVSEFHGFYMRYGPGQLVRVTSVSHRAQPIYQAISLGYEPEHVLLGGEAIAAGLCRALRAVVPNVAAVAVTEGGMGRFHAVVSIHRPRPGEGKRVALLAFGQVSILKMVTVVDSDIDVHDPRQVEWSIAARMRADEDVLVIPGVKADRCDPSSENGTLAKLALIATSRPGDANDETRVFAKAPDAILKRVKETFGTNSIPKEASDAR